MLQYIILLRAVNVSGKNILKMNELKIHLQNIGFQQISTYIQSGNIILSTLLSSHEVLQKVTAEIRSKFGFDVQAFVLTKSQLEQVFLNNPFPDDLPANRVFIASYSGTIDVDLLQTLTSISHHPEQFEIKGNTIYYYLPDGAANAKLSNAYFEKKLKISATSRNVSTIKKILSLMD